MSSDGTICFPLSFGEKKSLLTLLMYIIPFMVKCSRLSLILANEFFIRKFSKRVTIEFERTLYIKKYERYAKKKTNFMQDYLNACSMKLILEIILKLENAGRLVK